VSTAREDAIGESSAAVWGEAAWARGPLRATLGMRGDVIRANVASDLAANSGAATSALIGPKMSLAWRTSETTEVYLSAGRGFHSNDSRGVLLQVSHATLAPVDPAPQFSAADGVEVGARYEKGAFKASLALWALDLESELIFVGDVGETEVSGGTRRIGLEALFSWSPAPGVSFDASGAMTKARYRGDPAGGDRIPNALEYVVTAGVTARVWEGGVAQATLRRLGPAPLVEDNSARAPPATLVNLALVQVLGSWTVTLDVLNLLDSKDNDITYFYASRLPGEPADGVEDIHFHPIEPRQLRVSLKYAF
jgi:outer membrane receptor protein involved in Fe transport